MTFRIYLSFVLCVLFMACTPESPSDFQDRYPEALVLPSWYNPADMDTVKVLSWNVEHMVDQQDNPYIANDREDTPPENIEQRYALLAEAIKKADADIVVLQEFESDSFAQNFAEMYFPELGYQVFAAHESNDWYMNVVVMSRIPLGMFYSYATTNTPIIGQSDDEGNAASQSFTNNRMWTAEVMVNEDYDFALTGVHLKAGRGERNENWRLGQINLLKAHYERLLYLDKDQNLLAVGDFNSTPDSPEFQAFLAAGTQTEFIDPLAGSGIFSHPADSAFWRIDHILPNTHMMPEVIPGSVQVANYFSADSMRMIADHLPLEVLIVPSEQ